MELALNNQQMLMCHKTQQTKPSKYFISFNNLLKLLFDISIND